MVISLAWILAVVAATGAGWPVLAADWGPEVTPDVGKGALLSASSVLVSGLGAGFWSGNIMNQTRMITVDNTKAIITFLSSMEKPGQKIF
jgi:hypothetical protein